MQNNFVHTAKSIETCLVRMKTNLSRCFLSWHTTGCAWLCTARCVQQEQKKGWHQAPLRFLALVMGPVLGPAAAGWSSAAASAGTMAIASSPAASWLGWAASKASGASAAFLLPAVGLKRRSWHKKNRCEEQLVIRLKIMLPFKCQPRKVAPPAHWL